jgi:hypothetical protein
MYAGILSWCSFLCPLDTPHEPGEAAVSAAGQVHRPHACAVSGLRPGGTARGRQNRWARRLARHATLAPYLEHALCQRGGAKEVRRSQAVSPEKPAPPSATQVARKQPVTVGSAAESKRKCHATGAPGATSVAPGAMRSSGQGRVSLRLIRDSLTSCETSLPWGMATLPTVLKKARQGVQFRGWAESAGALYRRALARVPDTPPFDFVHR